MGTPQRFTACLLHAGWCVVRDHPLDCLAASPAPCGAKVCNSETRKPASRDGAHPYCTPNASLAISQHSESPHTTVMCSRQRRSHSPKSRYAASNPGSPHHSASEPCIARALDDVSGCLHLQWQATRRNHAPSRKVEADAGGASLVRQIYTTRGGGKLLHRR